MHYRILIENTYESFMCRAGESVLEGMARLGRKGIPIGCCGGGCGVCKVEITRGDYQVKAMSKSHISEQDLQKNRVLACRTFPLCDINLKVVGKCQRQFEAKFRLHFFTDKSRSV
ncbi:2Fe-2S iron-sulfur cluster-binding protein [Shewanella vesiculosa]|uniref:2Fe-2S iron-sulfur cluster-binding protein n=1 Tax=Shewanella vesiculosa TaxID=518738 RepID=UPI00384B0967